jgi:site-specific DNA-methyltransferase (adenine-specific)
MQSEAIGNCTVMLGDCINLMGGLRDIEAVVTSPPYNMGKDLHTFKNGVRKSQNYAGFSDFMPEDQYQDTQVNVLDLAYDICNGPMFYSHKDRIRSGQMISPLLWLYRSKWTVSQSIVLNKGSGANVDKRRFFPVHENIFVLHKDRNGKLKNDRCLTSVWQAKQVNRKVVGHPATMPIDAAISCISATDAKCVLDPYLGSGTTLLACAILGRRGVGIEVSQEYFDLSCRRLTELAAEQQKSPELF